VSNPIEALVEGVAGLARLFVLLFELLIKLLHLMASMVGLRKSK
jgi:hypothetical protein